MTLVRWSPWKELEDMQRGLSHILDDASFGTTETGRWVPAVDIRETDDAMLVQAELPGIDKKDVTNTFINKATCRAPQAVRIKTRRAGNGEPLPRRRNVEPGRLWGSLRASRRAAIRYVAPAYHSHAMLAPMRLAD